MYVTFSVEGQRGDKIMEYFYNNTEDQKDLILMSK